MRLLLLIGVLMSSAVFSGSLASEQGAFRVVCEAPDGKGKYGDKDDGLESILEELTRDRTSILEELKGGRCRVEAA